MLRFRRSSNRRGHCARYQSLCRLLAVPVLLTVLVPKISAQSGLKIAVRNSSPARGETITYLEKDRKREEERRELPRLQPGGGPFTYVPAPAIVRITRCDLNQVYVLKLEGGEYTSIPISKPSVAQRLWIAAQRALVKFLARPAPNLLIETTTQDTGERKQMFDRIARHVVTTVKQIPLVESRQLAQETVTDGWYIDLDTSLSCIKASPVSFSFLVGGRGVPILTFKNVGRPETGFALMTKEVHRLSRPLPDGSTPKDQITNEMQVTELSTGPLDPALFEVPKTFRKGRQIGPVPAWSYSRRLLAWFRVYWRQLERVI